MATSTQLIELDLNEISGVDHPANLHEGWLVLKSSTDPLEKALADAAEAMTNNNNGESNMELSHEETSDEVVEKEADSLNMDALQKSVDTLQKSLDAAEAANAALTAERDMEKATARVEDWATLPGVTPEEFAPVLRALHTESPEHAEIIEGVLDKCVTALGEADVLKEVGTEETSDDTSSYAKLEGLAKGLVEAGDAKSIADGIGKAAEAHPDIYAAYIQEKEA
jgi:hypothetical protein